MVLSVFAIWHTIDSYADNSVITEGNITNTVSYKLYSDGTLNIEGEGALKRYNQWSDFSAFDQYREQVKKIVIGEGVTQIVQYSFINNSNSEVFTNLESVEFPSTITLIGRSVFGNNGQFGTEKLKKVTFAENTNNLNTIDGYAFSKCTSLESINIPEGVTTIGTGAFVYCTSLTTITFPSTLTTVKESPLVGCKGLKEVNFKSMTAPELTMKDQSGQYYGWDGKGNRFTYVAEEDSGCLRNIDGHDVLMRHPQGATGYSDTIDSSAESGWILYKDNTWKDILPKEVQDVIDAIDAIGEVTAENYLDKESDITAAKDAYDALETDELKALVENYETLTAAVNAFNRFKLDAAKTAAISELEGAFDRSLYSGEELTKLNQAIEDGKTAINAATSEEAVSNAKSAAMEEARKAKTDAQIAEEALQEAKKNAKQEIDDKYDLKQYSGDEKAKLEKAIADAKSAIDAAESLEAVTLAKKNGIYEADKAKTDKQIADEKKAEIARKKAAAKKYTVKGLKVTSKSRKFTVTWKKTKGATGYQVQYKLKSAKKYKTLKTLKKLKVTSKKLKKGKKYQFKVRTYTTVKGTKVYGKWTKVKTIKCK